MLNIRATLLKEQAWIPSFIPDISLAPLQVQYYSEASRPQHWHCIGVNMLKCYWVKDSPKVPMWRLEWDSNQRPSGRKALRLPLSHHAPHVIKVSAGQQRQNTAHKALTILLSGHYIISCVVVCSVPSSRFQFILSHCTATLEKLLTHTVRKAMGNQFTNLNQENIKPMNWWFWKKQTILQSPWKVRLSLNLLLAS